ncbi:hypothetical protein WJX77_006521 [Trebouxia sp. C0004]
MIINEVTSGAKPSLRQTIVTDNARNMVKPRRLVLRAFLLVIEVHDACLQHHNGFCDGASTCTKPHQASASTGHLFQSQSSAFGFSQEACP